ncbi:hypothetical protein KUCAC02_016577, partial [Chaenocephalus aceratus]
MLSECTGTPSVELRRDECPRAEQQPGAASHPLHLTESCTRRCAAENKRRTHGECRSGQCSGGLRSVCGAHSGAAEKRRTKCIVWLVWSISRSWSHGVERSVFPPNL